MEKLREFDGKFDGVPEADSVGGLPEGTYQGEVTMPSSGVLLAEDKDGALRCRLIFEVVAADDEALKGRKVSKSWTLIAPDGRLDEKGVGFFKKDMRTLGVEIEGLSGAADALESTLGAVVQFARVDTTGVSKKTGKEVTYENVYLNSLVTAPPKKNSRKRR